MKIIPSILSNNPVEVKQMLYQCQDASVETVQIDVIDGVFANNKTIDPTILEEIETTLKYDFHLMVKEPINWTEKCIRSGADRIIGQIEMMSDQKEFVDKLSSFGMKVGLALDLDTPISKLDQTLLSDLDVVLIMSVKAGFGGQEFNSQALDKIKELDSLRSEGQYSFKICVDGGVTTQIIHDMAELKVDEVVVGRKLFENDLAQNIRDYQKA